MPFKCCSAQDEAPYGCTVSFFHAHRHRYRIPEKRLGKLEAGKVDGKALIRAALDSGRSGYIMPGTLAAIVERALAIGSSAVVKFPPRYLYSGDKIFKPTSAEEEQEAIAAGWSTIPPPPPPSRYPLNMVEIGIDSGPGLGPRGSDYRRVLLRNADEEQLFKQVTEFVLDGGCRA